MSDDLKVKAYMTTLICLFFIMLIGNHATKCTDVLMYDVTLLSILVIGVVIWMMAYDNIP